jgi:hypothetical protein
MYHKGLKKSNTKTQNTFYNTLYTYMNTITKKPIKNKMLVVRLSNYENLTLRLESAKNNTSLSKLVRAKLFEYEN